MDEHLKQLECDIVEEYKNLRKLYYGKNEAIDLVIERLLEDNKYRLYKDYICEEHIKNILDIN